MCCHIGCLALPEMMEANLQGLRAYRIVVWSKMA